MGTRIQHRRDTAANWTSNNPVLNAGELGFESDTNKFKIGDGSTLWTSLAYSPTTIANANITNDSSTTTTYPTFVDGATGAQALHSNANYVFNASTGVLGVNHLSAATTNSDLELLNNGTGRVLLTSDVYSARDSAGALLIRNHLNQGTLEVATDGTRLANIFNATINGTFTATASVLSTGTTDTTAASTGQNQFSGGLYVAKNIMSSASMSCFPGRLIKTGTATIGTTGSTLTLSSLPVFDAYKIFVRIDQVAATTYFLRMRINNNTTNNYDTMFISGTVTAGLSINSINQGWIISSGTEKTSSIQEINLEGNVPANGNKFKLTQVPTWENSSNTNVWVGGNWIDASNTNQVNRLDFNIYTTGNGTTPNSNNSADMTLWVKVYGINIKGDTFGL